MNNIEQQLAEWNAMAEHTANGKYGVETFAIPNPKKGSIGLLGDDKKVHWVTGEIPIGDARFMAKSKDMLTALNALHEENKRLEKRMDNKVLASLVVAAKEENTSLKAQLAKAMEATHYFDDDEWEYTTPDIGIVLDTLDEVGDGIVCVGHMRRLEDVVYARRYNEVEDEYETKEFKTRSEAESWVKEKTNDQR